MDLCFMSGLVYKWARHGPWLGTWDPVASPNWKMAFVVSLQ